MALLTCFLGLVVWQELPPKASVWVFRVTGIYVGSSVTFLGAGEGGGADAT